MHAQDKVVMRDRLTAARRALPGLPGGRRPGRAGRLRRRARLAGDRQDLARRLRRQGRVEDRRPRPRRGAVRGLRPTGCADPGRGVRRLRPRAERAGGPLAVGPGGGVPGLGDRCSATGSASRPSPRRRGSPTSRRIAIEQLALRIAHELGVVGVLAVELMQRRDGTVVVNELAMRPHNTGHWSIDGAHTSQFENHLRAVLDLPLGDPTARAPVDGDGQRPRRHRRGPALGAAALLRPRPDGCGCSCTARRSSPAARSVT